MSISGESAEDITLDLYSDQPEGMHASFPVVSEPFVSASADNTYTDASGLGGGALAGSDLVFYLVVNPHSDVTSATATSGSEPSLVLGADTGGGGENEDRQESLDCERAASVGLDSMSTQGDSVGIVAESTYSLEEEDLNTEGSTQRFITDFSSDNVLNYVSEEISVCEEADSFHVADHLLQTGLTEVDMTDMKHKLETEEHELDSSHSNQDGVPAVAMTVGQVPGASTVQLVSTPGIHQVVSIGGQFLLYTGPPLSVNDTGIDVTTTTSLTLTSPLTFTSPLTLTSPLTFTSAGLVLGSPAGGIEFSSLQACGVGVGGGVVKAEGNARVVEPPAKRIRLSSDSDGGAVENVTVVGLTSSAQQQTSTDLDTQDCVAKELDVTQAWFTTKDDKIALQSNGKTWKQGQWSKDEVDILQRNIANYCVEHSIEDPAHVIFNMTKEERKNFYRTVSRGLNRPLFSVYRRVIRMYDATNHIGKYTQEELEKLRSLREKHGSDWSAIGLALGRSPSSVKDRCRLLKERCNSGKWVPEEEDRLAEAVQRLTGLRPDESVTTGLSWASIAEHVGTRSEKQCRTKWLNYLNWRQRGGTGWNRADDIMLIDKVYQLGVKDETLIDWDELAKNWSSVRSPQWLRGKWWSLKRHVVNYQLLTFPEILDALKHSHRLICAASGGDDWGSGNTEARRHESCSGQPLDECSSDTVSDMTTTSQENSCDASLLSTLTQQQMVEMQPGDLSLKLVLPGDQSSSDVT